MRTKVTEMKIAAACIGLMICSAATGWPAEPAESDTAEIRQAKSLFDQYIRMESGFDPRIADLYSEDAVIRNTRKYPDGTSRVIAIPAKQYKQLVRTLMPIAKQHGDTSVYTDSTFSSEGDGVRIKASRYPNLKNYESPISILVRPDKSGEWRITEELTESRVVAE
jgi:hypothetical protein